MKRRRLNPRARAEAILLAAVEVAQDNSYKYMTREDIAKRAGVTDPLVTFHFKGMEALREQVLEHAIKNEILSIIAQGVVSQDPVAMAAPKALRNRALRQLMGA